jgi:hypothetical protein
VGRCCPSATIPVLGAPPRPLRWEVRFFAVPRGLCRRLRTVASAFSRTSVAAPKPFAVLAIPASGAPRQVARGFTLRKPSSAPLCVLRMLCVERFGLAPFRVGRAHPTPPLLRAPLRPPRPLRWEVRFGSVPRGPCRRLRTVTRAFPRTSVAAPKPFAVLAIPASGAPRQVARGFTLRKPSSAPLCVLCVLCVGR